MNIKQTYHKLQQESVQNFNGHLSAWLLFIIENLIFLIKTLTRESWAAASPVSLHKPKLLNTDFSGTNPLYCASCVGVCDS